MKRNLLLRIAGTLSILTCVAHLMGTFMEIPAEQTEVLEAVSVMEQTEVPMPIGSARSYMQILDGNNLSTALLLLVFGLLLFFTAASPKSISADRTILIVSLGLVGFAVISAIYFFPVPVVTTGLAGLLAFIARTRSVPVTAGV